MFINNERVVGKCAKMQVFPFEPSFPTAYLTNSFEAGRMQASPVWQFEG